METPIATEGLATPGRESHPWIFRLLVEAGGKRLNAGLIGEKLASATPSFRLVHPRRVGLIEVRHESRVIDYRAEFEAMGAPISFFTQSLPQ